MTIKYYQHDPSAPCRMVTMTLKALAIDAEFITTRPLHGETKTPEFLAMNPRGKIPCLKDGEFVIYESRAIACYLCNKYEKGEDAYRLYPVEPEARGTVDQILCVSAMVYDTILEYANVMGIFLRNEKSRNDSKHSDVEKALRLCEGSLCNKQYMAGSHLTLADFFMACSITLLSIPGFDGIANYPKIQAWLAKIKALPYYDEVNKEAMEEFMRMYQDRIKA